MSDKPKTTPTVRDYGWDIAPPQSSGRLKPGASIEVMLKHVGSQNPVNARYCPDPQNCAKRLTVRDLRGGTTKLCGGLTYDDVVQRGIYENPSDARPHFLRCYKDQNGNRRPKCDAACKVAGDLYEPKKSGLGRLMQACRITKSL